MEQQEGEVSLWLYQEEQVLVVQFQLRHAVFWTFFFLHRRAKSALKASVLLVC